MAYYIFDEKKLVRNIFHRSGGSFLSAILTSRLSSPRCIEQQSVTSPSCKMINSRIRPSAQCLPKVASFCQDQRRIYVGFAIIKINNVRIIDVIGPARSLSRGRAGPAPRSYMAEEGSPGCAPGKIRARNGHARSPR
jgi:hypothetical protein